MVVEFVVPGKRPEVVSLTLVCRRDGVDNGVGAALATVAIGRTGTGPGDAHIKPNMGRWLEADDLPAVDGLLCFVEW